MNIPATTGDTWACTGEVRWRKDARGFIDVFDRAGGRVLQQAWRNQTTGAVEWRDVPTEEA